MALIANRVCICRPKLLATLALATKAVAAAFDDTPLEIAVLSKTKGGSTKLNGWRFGATATRRNR